jgi:hypothetical protein
MATKWPFRIRIRNYLASWYRIQIYYSGLRIREPGSETLIPQYQHLLNIMCAVCVFSFIQRKIFSKA